MDFTNVKNLKWANKEHTAIDLECNFSHLKDEAVPFTASPNDTEQHGRDLFQKAVNGEFGEIAEYVKPIIILTYEEKRQIEYLSFGEQLDMMYWDSINGTTNWKDHVNAVKLNNPKPVE